MGVIKKKLLRYYVLLLFLLLPSLVWSQEFMELPRPNYKIDGIPRKKLKVIKEILSDFDKDLFFAQPYLLEVNKQGFIFVYDLKLVKIFIFDNHFQLVGQCLSQGQAPGQEFAPFNQEMFVSAEGILFFLDGVGHKIMQFDSQGKYLREKRLDNANFSTSPFRPVLDKNGFLYTISNRGSIVDKYNKDLKFVSSYLDKNMLEQFIFYRPPYEAFYKNYPKYAKLKLWLNPDNDNIYYDITADDQLFIFIHRSATAFLFNKEKMVGKFDVLIDRALTQFKEMVIKNLAERKNRQQDKTGIMEMNMFQSCFVARDENCVYFQNLYSDQEYSLYKFDFKGNLLEIYSNCEHNVIFKAKSNGLFYGLSKIDRHPVIFKIQEKERK